MSRTAGANGAGGEDETPQGRGLSCGLTFLLMLVPLASILIGLLAAAQGLARGPAAQAAIQIYRDDRSCAVALDLPARGGTCSNVDVVVLGPAPQPSPAPSGAWTQLALKMTTGYVANEDVGARLFALAKPQMAARAQLFDGFVTRVELGGVTGDTPENPLAATPQSSQPIWSGAIAIVFGFAYIFIVPRYVRKRLAAGKRSPERQD